MDVAPYCSSFFDACSHEKLTDMAFKNSFGNKEQANSCVEQLFENKEVDIHELHDDKHVFLLINNLSSLIKRRSKT